ncbi:MAG TPA: hypothetical protein DDY13_03420 [Cytophagales bacterium]|jgi:short-subunit dehydrogenase involved in D-alanine esterification of teichoic acids|nr:hypothetical protein [Cytophagales bacterium]
MLFQGNKRIVKSTNSMIGVATAKKFVGLNNEVIAIGTKAEKPEKSGKTVERVIPFNSATTKIENLDKLAVFNENKHPVFEGPYF